MNNMNFISFKSLRSEEFLHPFKEIKGNGELSFAIYGLFEVHVKDNVCLYMITSKGNFYTNNEYFMQTLEAFLFMTGVAVETEVTLEVEGNNIWLKGTKRNSKKK